MSWEWDEFKARRDSGANRRDRMLSSTEKPRPESKRRKLFKTPQEEEIFDFHSDEENDKVSEPAKGIHLSYKRINRITEDAEDSIDSFSSEEEGSNASPRVQKQSKTPKSSSKSKRRFTNPVSRTKSSKIMNKSMTLTASFIPSPLVRPSSKSIQSSKRTCDIQEFSSSDDSLVEATPPLGNYVDLSSGSPLLQPGSMFLTQQSKTKSLIAAAERIRVSNSKRVEAAKTLKIEFDQFSDFQTVSRPVPDIHASDYNSAALKTGDWLSNIKAPEIKFEIDDGDSAKKANIKFPVGSLARRAERLGNHKRGAVTMWLHELTSAPHMSPINEFCFAGEVQSVNIDAVGNQVINTSWPGLHNLEVNVVLSKYVKQIEIKVSEVIIVYPEFYKAVSGSMFYILSGFHHHSYDKMHLHLNSFDLCTMFRNVAESFVAESSDELVSNFAAESFPITIKQDSPHILSVAQTTKSCLVGVSLILCVYSIVVQGDKYVLLCVDSANSPVLITLDHSAELWEVISTSLKTPLIFTNLSIVYRSRMKRSYCRYPSLRMFKPSKKLVYSLVSCDRTVITLAEEPFHDVDLLEMKGRISIVAKYLHSLRAKSATVSFVSSALGTIQSIEHQAKLDLFHQLNNQIIEFSNLKALSSKTFQFDELSSYEVYFVCEKPPYPFISRKVDDSQLGIFNNIKYCLELFNQCTPIYSLCKIKFYVNQIRYEGRLYHVVAMTQSVKATVLVTPQTIRAWLGSEIITEMSLKRLVGKRFELVVVVTGTLKLYNIDRKLFSRML